MNCAQVQRYVDAYADGEVEPSEAIRIETHLVECGLCAERVELSRAIKQGVRADAREHRAPASLRARIEASRAKLEPRAERDRERPMRPSWQSAIPWLSAAAAAVAVGGGVQAVTERTGVGGRMSQASIASIDVDDLARQHAHPLPAEEIDPERIRIRFSPIVGVPVHPVSFGKLDVANHLDGPPNFLGGSYQFAGARLVPLRDETTASLLYEGKGTRVTVFVYDPQRIHVQSSCCLERRVIRRGDIDKTIMFGRARNGYALAVSEGSGVGYAVSGDLAEPEMVSIASEL
ncbi:MAG: anti-sigma factor family protein [Polyangiales bacterium]